MVNNTDWHKAMKIERVRTAFRQMPARIGNLAERHFKESFRQKGFIDESLEPWPARKHNGRGSLLIVSGALKRSIRRTSTTFNSVTIVAGDGVVNYARIHNEGGTVHPTVTDKMRKFAWAMTNKAAGEGQADMWKGIALTRKSKLDITIPKRKFMGQSAMLDRNTMTMITTELNKIFQ
jgi:phage gpG-like protein